MPRTRSASKRKLDSDQQELEVSVEEGKQKQKITKKPKKEQQEEGKKNKKLTIKGQKQVEQEEEEEEKTSNKKNQEKEEEEEEEEVEEKKSKKSTAKKITHKKNEVEESNKKNKKSTSTTKKSIKKQHKDEDEDMDGEEDEDEDEDNQDGNNKHKDNKKSQNKENEEDDEDDDDDDDDEEEDPERPQLDHVSIPSWSSITLPPITSHPCDIPGATEKSKVRSTHIYGKGICKDIFQGQECKNTSSEHRTQFFHEFTPSQHTSIAKKKQKDTTIDDLFPIYGHPALAYTWKYGNENKHGNGDETREAVKSIGIPNEIVNMVMENTAPSLNIFWRADIEYCLDDDDDNSDEEDAERSRSWKNEMKQWEKNEKEEGNNRVIIPQHPKYAIRSHIGGIGYLRPNESAPRCGKCKKIMPLYVQIRLSDMPREAAIGYAAPNIPIQRQLLQCWGCPDENHDQHARSPPDEDADEDDDEGEGVLIRIIDMGDDTLKCDAMQAAIKETRELEERKEKDDQDGDGDEDEDDMFRLPFTFIEKWIEYKDAPSCHEWNDLLHLYNDKDFQRNYHQDIYHGRGQDENEMIKLGGYCDVNVDTDEGDSAYSNCVQCRRQMQIVIQLPSSIGIQWGASGVRASIQQCPVHRDQFVFAWEDPQEHF